MRVYELAKKLNLTSKDLMERLAAEGFQVQSHMTIVPQEAIDLLTKKIRKQEGNERPAPKAEAEKIIMPAEKVIEKPSVDILLMQENQKEPELPKGIIPLKSMQLGVLAELMNLAAGELIVALLKQGKIYNKNQVVSEKIVEQLATLFGFQVERSRKEEIAAVKKHAEVKHLSDRSPVVVVIGHVDHGKTTLLDFIRKTRVAAKEKGGITQHLGAYQVKTNHGGIIFLDTPGHEAFALMRKRGVRVADIAVVVVAADDGIMPQTIEAIKQAQAAEIPIVVAINKIDKVDATRIETVKKQLSQYGLVAEDWGGQTIVMPISAKLGTGVDALLEILALQAEIMELRADATLPAEGSILEAKIQKGFGAVATFLAKHGTLRVGDFFVVGDTTGKVVSIVDSHGKRLQNIGPAIPVQISGFDKLPQAGDYLQVIPAEEYKRLRSVSVERKILAFSQTEGEEVTRIMLKADTESSKEAILESIKKLSTQEKKSINVIHASVGDISESDIALAATTGSMIYGFGVKVESNAVALSQEKAVGIRQFDIIYRLLDNLRDYIKASEKKELIREKIGEAIVKKVFDIKKIGKIAGFQVKQGKIARNGEIEVWREGNKIGSGKIQSLQREKKMMKEVGVGFEGALLVDGFDDWLEGDRIDCFVQTSQA